MKLGDLIVGDDFKVWFLFRDEFFEQSYFYIQLKRLLSGKDLKDFIKLFSSFEVCSVTLSSCFVRVCLDLSFLSILDLADFYETVLKFSGYEVVT